MLRCLFDADWPDYSEHRAYILQDAEPPQAHVGLGDHINCKSKRNRQTSLRLDMAWGKTKVGVESHRLSHCFPRIFFFHLY